MSGTRNGVQALVKSEASKVLYVHKFELMRSVMDFIISKRLFLFDVNILLILVRHHHHGEPTRWKFVTDLLKVYSRTTRFFKLL